MTQTRTRRQTPGVIANNAPEAKRKRYEAMREKRTALAKNAGFDSDKRLLGAMLKSLKAGPQYGWYLLEPKVPCQKCNNHMTDLAKMYQLQGWLLLRPICIDCAKRDA